MTTLYSDHQEELPCNLKLKLKDNNIVSTKESQKLNHPNTSLPPFQLTETVTNFEGFEITPLYSSPSRIVPKVVANNGITIEKNKIKYKYKILPPFHINCQVIDKKNINCQVKKIKKN